MKLEALQSLSVAVMIAGLFLSALGGFGAYFFSGGSERNGHAQNPVPIESTEPELPLRDADADSRLAAIVEPIPEVTAKQLSLNPDPALPPVPEKPPEAVATPPPQRATPEPAPVIAKTTIPEKTEPLPPPVAEKLPAPAPPVAKAKAPEPKSAVKTVAARTPKLGLEPWQNEKLLQRLRTFQNGSIAIQVPEGNDEAMGFATAIKDAFLTAGWHVTGLTAVKMDREVSGLTLSSGTFPPPTEVTTIFSALISAGIKLSTELDPAQGKKHSTLFVGSRP
ncbi:MAG: hypothetical protein ABIZ56_01675 [Chthoniobacteraceae bacterium]